MRSRHLAAAVLAFLSVAFARGPALGQGIIIDRRPHIPIARSYEVREVSLDARIRDQGAEVQVSQTFYNPGSTALEVEYLFPMPDDGAIQNFTLMVDGRELPGKILRKDEARRIYEGIVRAKQDPALLEYMGRGLFQTSVFPVPPRAERRVTMRYTQLCRRDRDVVEFAYPFATQKFTAKPIQTLSLTVRIESLEPIKSVYCASHDARIDRPNDREVTVRLNERDVVPMADFRLLYTLAEGAVGASILSYRPSESEDGYFLVLASPRVRAADTKPQPKTVVFVLDRSGSMNGKKIEQAKGALKFVLDNLRDGDTFNIVVYDDRVETFKPELQRYTNESRAEAGRFVENIRAGGSTNIDGALGTALSMLRDDSQPNYVLFLTDGLPTAGEQREPAIADNARRNNKGRARLFVFGVGFDVNARLLDRLSGGNSGASEYVKPDQDIESSVSRFYSKLTSPVLSNIRLELAGIDVNRGYPRDVPDLFEGGQLVWVGRYRQSGHTTLRISGQVGKNRQSFEFPAELFASGIGPRYDFVERLWAMRRVGDIIDQLDLHGQNRELIDELVDLSKRYGILTPYTAFLADETVRLHARDETRRRAGVQLEMLEQLGGAGGVAQREYKGRLLRADKPADSFEAAKRAPASAPAPGGGGGGAAGSTASRGGRATAGFPAIIVDAEGKESVATTVRQVGAKTFFRRSNAWVDSDVKPEEEAKATVIEQFSDKFFELAASQAANLNQYLTLDDVTVVKLKDRVYRFERPKKP
jgi:Ca-activated chloride channel family protein